MKSKDIIDYLTQSLRFFDKPQLTQLAELLLDEKSDYYFFGLSACELETLIIDCLKRANDHILYQCAKKFIPETTNFSRCQVCKRFMDTDPKLQCGHQIHTNCCFFNGECPECIEHVLDLYKPRARL